ncbi:patatin-like phospholipase family protein [Shewanella intestini]|uniref:BamA/TamA family outer membrane protein n=1 Tax=Shewanella intestini TaxID=2017544 RepID=A0ABS5I523_9GAMM|nr:MULTISPECIES: patatin-like phospholipase family protein [Shewanella]MBR9729114.1 BamA/TamA family outer membrane protein [Shewanella intestini]MRG37190.1 BamA/TamA family outer membrane protein [Shewanella sp. XMDDZSB0408]
MLLVRLSLAFCLSLLLFSTNVLAEKTLKDTPTDYQNSAIYAKDDSGYSPNNATHAHSRPTIGLVLSGGGAKGAAHIGVLKVLEANHIPVDYIAGTSIGSYVGGMYAMGYSADEIEKIMFNSNWAEGYSDTIAREDLSYRDKQLRDRFNIPLNLGFNDGKVTLPGGLLRGQTMSLLLRQSTDLIEQYGDFDSLSIPYRAVATDLASSKAVVLSKGSIVKAMQASATVPGALQPSEMDGKLLVDGGIANNMPVDVVKAMGADIVIAVDIGSPLAGKESLDSAISVLEQLSTILTQASATKQKALLSSHDILIRPAIDDMSTTDFTIMPQALKVGIEAANLHLSALQKLSVSDQEYQQYLDKKQQRRQLWSDPIKRPLMAINFDNDSKVSQRLLQETLDFHVGEVITKVQLDAALKRLYALNKFERVDAEFTDTPTGRKLTVTTKGKSWGPNYFQAGFNWEDDFTLESAMTFSMAYTMTDLTPFGGEWRNEVELGYRSMLATEFYQPLDNDQRFYSLARVQYDSKKWSLYQNNEKIHDLDNNVGNVNVGVGINFSNKGLLEIGSLFERGRIEEDYYLPQTLIYQSWGGYFKVAYDTLNSISFPTEGNRFTFITRARDEHFNDTSLPTKDGVSWEFEADWKGALNLGNHAIVGKAEVATADSENGFTVHPSELGGFLNLSGYHKQALTGAHKVFAAILYQYDLSGALTFTELPVYLGTSLEAGNVWQTRGDMDIKDLIYSSSLYLGTDTDWGPAALGFGFTDTGEQAFYLFIGKNF